MYMYVYVCIVLYPVDSSVHPTNVHNKVQHRKRIWYKIWHVQYLVASHHNPWQAHGKETKGRKGTVRLTDACKKEKSEWGSNALPSLTGIVTRTRKANWIMEKRREESWAGSRWIKKHGQ